MRVILADDNILVLQSTKRLLSRQKWLRVVGCTTYGAQCPLLVKELNPDVVIVDLEMPDMNGLEITRRIKAVSRPPLVIILSSHDEVEYREFARQAGSDAFVSKSLATSELTHVLCTFYRQSKTA